MPNLASLLAAHRISLAIALAFGVTACSGSKDEVTDTSVPTDSSPYGSDQTDSDNDGFPMDQDCDDTDASVNPDADELCDGVDNDCDGDVDEDPVDANTWYEDYDDDGFGDDDSAVTSCDDMSGYVDVGGDCDDTDPGYNPDADEDDCTDPNDYNCDGSVGYDDADGDGFAACDDCDDSDGDINPDAEEVCDGEDNDCDDEIDEDATDTSTWYEDTDGDGHGDAGSTTSACDEPEGYSSTSDDCDDRNEHTYPGADELCDELDNDCDGEIDEDATELGTWYADEDGDTYGDPDTAVESCERPAGYVPSGGDCDDTDDYVNPGEDEYCNDVDDDCDGSVDESDAVDADTWYRDYDSDGFGNPSSSKEACDEPTGYVADDNDCDDRDDDVNPDADEVCDDDDNDCDGDVDEEDADLDWSTADEYYADTDGDGYGDPDATTDACSTPSGYSTNDDDCDDDDEDVNPAETEICDGIDNDCDGDVDDEDAGVDLSTLGEYYADTDGDGYGDPDDSVSSCSVPDGYVTDDSDCDDEVDTTHPDADEYCDDVDNDCDDDIDEDAVDGAWYPADADGDGFGDPDVEEWTCRGPDNDWDCLDDDPLEPQVVNGTVGSGGDGSRDAPWDTIQEGIDNAFECVVVYGGTYNEALDLSGKDLTITGVEGADGTIIDATDTDAPAVTVASGEDVRLIGLSFTGGTGNAEETSESYSCGSGDTCTDYYTNWCGGGLYVDGSSVAMTGVKVFGNSLPPSETTTASGDTWYTYSFGGGACLVDATLEVSDSTFLGNYADQGGAIYADEASVATVDGTWIIVNSATDGGGVQVDGGQVDMTNVLSTWNNAADYGGGVFVLDGTLNETNVTHGGDDATDGGGLYLTGTASATVMNTIIYDAATGTGVTVDGSSASWDGSYNNVWGNEAGEYSGVTDPTGSDGNLSANPRFTSVTSDGDATNDTWTLRSSSPSVDAGNPSSAYDDADGTTNDQGAYGGPNSEWDD